jgi:antitoxin component YwqK of YwqJK toxin-antitoxin module
MATEYIWFKRGKESKRSVDKLGEKPLSEKLPNGVEIKYEYTRRGEPLTKGFYVDGELHSIDGEPAYIQYTPEGDVEGITYYKNGKGHRAGDKPASILYWADDTDNVYMQYWSIDGILTKSTEHWRDGKLMKEMYHNSKADYHRDEDKPAVTIYSIDGTTKNYEEYYKNGERHRDGDKPAGVTYYNDGKTLSQEIWMQDDEWHREGKPAIISYDRDGNVTDESYYKNGTEVDH